jgi:hypothetical protein
VIHWGPRVMIFVFGLRLFGRVDSVPGRFYVATEFYHVQLLPIVPMQSWLITRQEGGSWEGVKIPLCRKSVAVAWVRGVAAITAFVAGLWALAEAGATTDGDWQVPAALGLVAAAAFAATKLARAITHATCERACELARLAGYRERGIDEIRELYGESAGEGAASESDGATGPVADAPDQMFFVSGRDNSSGQEVCLTVWAKDEQTARTASAGRGMDVSSVEPAVRTARR